MTTRNAFVGAAMLACLWCGGSFAGETVGVDSVDAVAADASVDEMLAANGPTAPDNCTAFRFQFWFPGWFATVRWTDNSSDEDGFVIEWHGPRGERGSTIVPANSTETFGLPSGPNWKYRVRAFNASGQSGWSNWAVATTGGIA